MTQVVTGKAVPQFTLPSTAGKDFRLRDARGNWVILYFYPRDATPGCTTESAAFRDLHSQFTAAGAQVLGISRDSLASHAKFRLSLGLPFDLLSDADETACKLFDVIGEKNMYGKKVLGIERSTFLIDAKGVLRHEWRKVKVPGHAEQVLETLRTAS